jgi:hemoglobin-like flavoprotein
MAGGALAVAWAGALRLVKQRNGRYEDDARSGSTRSGQLQKSGANRCYGSRSAIAPQFRPLFPLDLREQKTKLIAMLATVVVNLHQLERMMAQVEQLGRRHVTYGVTADHYAPVGEALLWTLEQGLGAEFTPSVKAAWTEAYLALSGAMKRAAAERLHCGRATTGADTEANWGSARTRTAPGRVAPSSEKQPIYAGSRR